MVSDLKTLCASGGKIQENVRETNINTYVRTEHTDSF